MNKLEEKVRANQAMLDEKFSNKKAIRVNRGKTKTGFTDGWDKGWGNHGGPPVTEKTLVSKI